MDKSERPHMREYQELRLLRRETSAELCRKEICKVKHPLYPFGKVSSGGVIIRTFPVINTGVERELSSVSDGGTISGPLSLI
jgi:hypothetical protein